MLSPHKHSISKPAWAWALYDFANMGYAMIVLALIYPRFYRTFWADQLTVSQQTSSFNLCVFIASIIVALLAPILGSLAATGGLRKNLLIVFACLGITASIAIALVDKEYLWLVNCVYVFGTVSYYCSNIFFDSMLGTVSHADNRNFISGLGFALGYTAGLLLIIVSSFWSASVPEGDLVAQTAISRWHFVLGGCWWALFMLPLVMVIREERKPLAIGFSELVRNSLVNTWETFLDILKVKHIFWFLIAYLFYIDGVNSIILNATSYGTAIGFSEREIGIGFLCVHVVGIPCALLFGWLADKFGARKMILIAIVAYGFISLYGTVITNHPVNLFGFAIPEMYILASAIGMVQGGIQALSRAYFASIVPEDKAVAYFGFYSMLGKSAAIFGPLLIFLAAWIFDDPAQPLLGSRIGFGALTLLFILGAVCFVKSRPSAVEG